MNKSVVLMDDHFAPVTSAIGFLRAPLDVVADGLLAWRTRIHGSATIQKVDGGLRENIAALEPLTSAVKPRELIVATANPEWVATFDCGAQGGDPVTTVGYLSRALRIQGLMVMSVPDAEHRPGTSAPYGARQMELYSPTSTDFLNSVRAISVTQDEHRWRFDAVGTIQDFEDLEAYSRRKVADRFTGRMLLEYAAEFGLRPFDDDFYPGPSALVLNPAVPPPNTVVLGLVDNQKRLGIVPR